MFPKKALVLIVLAALALSPAAAFAGSANGNGTQHYGPFPSTSPDSGTCGNFWATDSFNRFFTVDPQNPNVVTEEFKQGSFVTNAGPSPAACESDPGGTVSAGLTGSMEGSFDILVTGGTYDPSAVCTLSTCNTTAGFISTVYGPNATYTTGATYYIFHYNAANNGEWKNASTSRGGDHGDITGS